MKQVVLLCLLGMVLSISQAQEKTKVKIIEKVSSADTSVYIRHGDTILRVIEDDRGDSIQISTRRYNINVGEGGLQIDKKEDVKKKVLVTRVGLIDVGFAGFLSNGSLNMPSELEAFDLRSGKSRNINFQLFTQRVRFANYHMNFSYGLMFEFNKYRFSNSTKLDPGVSPLTWETLDVDLRKNKLKATYLYVPLMFGVESNPDKVMKSFRARAGVYAGILLNAKQKTLVTITDREKVNNNFNLNKFRWGVRGEMGYGLVNFYVQYSFASMFKEDQGPDLQPINFGIMLLPF